MSNCSKCDRCKKIIDLSMVVVRKPESDINDLVEPKEKVVRLHWTDQPYRVDFRQQISGTDLCEKCLLELKEWLKGDEN